MSPPIHQFELKRAEVTAQGRFVGIASAFGVKDRHGDVVERGAFASTIQFLQKQGARLPLLWQHKQDEPIGHIVSLEERDDGLHIEGQLIMALRNAKTAYDLMEAGAAYISYGYEVTAGEPMRGGGTRITGVDLGEISIVSTPANPYARVTSVKSAILSSPVEFEKAARELLGLSNREAKKLARGGWSALADTNPEHTAIEAALTRITELEI